MPEMKKTGKDWKLSANFLAHLSDQLNYNLKLAIRQSAEHLDGVITKHLDQQDLGWQNSTAWTAYKEAHGYSTDVWRMTNTLSQNIAIVYTDGGLSAFVGVKRGIKSEDGALYEEIAYVLEFGSESLSITPKPLFRPSFAESQTFIKERVELAIKSAMGLK